MNSQHVNSSRAGFTIPELIAAVCILAVLSTCFYVSLGGVHRLQTRFEAERNAILVMNNVLERLEAEQTRTRQDAESIFQDEFRKSSLSRDERFTPFFGALERVITIRITGPNDRILAGLELTE